VPFPVKVKTNVKGIGQECPIHTGKSNVKGIGQECPIHTGKVKVKGSGRGHPLYAGLSTKVDVYFRRLYVLPPKCESGIGSENCAARGGRVFRLGWIRDAGCASPLFFAKADEREVLRRKKRASG